MGANRTSYGGMTPADAALLLGQIGARIRAARHQRRMSQRQLAAAAGLSGPSIANIERGAQGAINVLVLRAFAHALQLSPNWLLGVDDGDTPAAPRAELAALLRAAADTLDSEPPDPPPGR